MARIFTSCIVVITVLCLAPAALAAGKFDRYYDRGVEAYQQKKYIKAIEWFKKAAAARSRRPEPYEGIGLCHLYLKEYNAAAKAFRKAIEFDPNNPKYYRHLAHAYAKQRKFDKAIETYNKVLSLDPDDIVCRYNLALVLDNARDTTRAEAEYKNVLSRIGKAISLAKKNSDGSELKKLRGIALTVKKSLAILYYNGKKYAEAAAILDKAVKAHPQNPEIYYLLGAVTLSLGKPNEAIKHLNIAIELNYDKPAEVYHKIGNAYVDLKKYDDAIKAYKRAIFESPSYGRAYYNLGELYRFKNELKKALDMYETAAAAASMRDDPSPWRGIGSVRYEQDRLLEAEEAFRKAVSLEQGDRKTLIDLANVLSDLGNFSGALSELKYVKALGGTPELETLIAITGKRLERRKAGPVKKEELEQGRLWSKAWIASGKRFKVRSNTTPELCEEYLEILERVMKLYIKEFDIRVDTDKGITRVYVFSRREDYRRFCSETAPKLSGAAGLFDPKRRIIALYRKRGILPDGTREVLQHEALHLATYLAFHRNLPGWLAEGLAECYERLTVGADGRASRPGVHPAHIKTINKHIVEKKMLTMRQMLDSDRERFFDSRDSIYYAQSWVLVHLLKTEHSSAFDKMLSGIRRGQEPEKAVDRMMKRIFGSDAALENAWKLHFKSLAEKAKKEK
ncbi:MAG: tetratricopeptide repeat protein [Planctomycetota bacterium]|nr:MAG: tetratricopeptide repeat protein [Planctomycetota bacterium]